MAHGRRRSITRNLPSFACHLRCFAVHAIYWFVRSNADFSDSIFIIMLQIFFLYLCWSFFRIYLTATDNVAEQRAITVHTYIFSYESQFHAIDDGVAKQHDFQYSTNCVSIDHTNLLARIRVLQFLDQYNIIMTYSVFFFFLFFYFDNRSSRTLDAIHQLNAAPVPLVMTVSFQLTKLIETNAISAVCRYIYIT